MSDTTTDLRLCPACKWAGHAAAEKTTGKCPCCDEPTKPLPPIDTSNFPTPEVIGAKFVDVLREWIKDPGYWDGDYEDCETAEEAWAKMCADNAADHSNAAEHDWCDANMAMDEAMRALGMGAALDHPMWAENQAMVDVWNAAYAAAKPALRGEVVS